MTELLTLSVEILNLISNPETTVIAVILLTLRITELIKLISLVNSRTWTNVSFIT